MQYLLVAILAAAFAILQSLIGGVKLVYGLPAYAAFGLAGVLAVAVPWRRPAPRPDWFALGTTLLLAGYVIWRTLASPVDYLARSDFYMTIGALVVYLIAATHLSGTRERMMLLWVLLAFAATHAAVGAVQFKGKENYMLLPWIYRPDYGYRASGFYICPNHLAGLLETLGLFALSVCCWGRGKPWVRILAGYAVLMCLGGVAITGSRGGYLSTVLGLCAFAAISLWLIRRLRRGLFWGMVIVAGIVVAGVVGGAFYVMSQSDDLRSRMGEIYDPKNMRLLLWAAAITQWKLSPIIGTGSGTYLYYGRQFRSELVQADPQHAHCDYLELLSEYGVVGCVLMAAFLLAHLRTGFVGLRNVVERKLKPSWRTSSNELALLVGGLCAVFVLLAHSVIDFNLHIPGNTLVVAFIFGILANPHTKPEVETRPGGGIEWWRGFAPVMGAVLLVVSIPRIEAEYYGERARVYLRDQMYPECRAYSERALAHETRNPDLYYYLGESQHYLALESANPRTAMELHAAAANAFSKGLEVFPHDLRLMLKLGRTLDTLGRFDAAEALFQRALAADPNFGNVYAFYGLHHHLQGHFDQAKALYQKAQSLDEREVSTIGLRDLEKDRKLKKSNDVFKDLISDPDEDEPMDEALPKK